MLLFIFRIILLNEMSTLIKDCLQYKLLCFRGQPVFYRQTVDAILQHVISTLKGLIKFIATKRKTVNKSV